MQAPSRRPAHIERAGLEPPCRACAHLAYATRCDGAHAWARAARMQGAACSKRPARLAIFSRRPFAPRPPPLQAMCPPKKKAPPPPPADVEMVSSEANDEGDEGGAEGAERRGLLAK